jgi:hypothetical protein
MSSKDVLKHIGHNMTPGRIEKAIDEFWDRSEIFPVPRCSIGCPICECQKTFIKDWMFFEKELKPGAFRADIQFKCPKCSHVFKFGVNIPPETFQRAGAIAEFANVWTFRDVKTYFKRKKQMGGEEPIIYYTEKNVLTKT